MVGDGNLWCQMGLIFLQTSTDFDLDWEEDWEGVKVMESVDVGRKMEDIQCRRRYDFSPIYDWDLPESEWESALQADTDSGDILYILYILLDCSYPIHLTYKSPKYIIYGLCPLTVQFHNKLLHQPTWISCFNSTTLIWMPVLIICTARTSYLNTVKEIKSVRLSWLAADSSVSKTLSHTGWQQKSSVDQRLVQRSFSWPGCIQRRSWERQSSNQKRFHHPSLRPSQLCI